MKVCILLLTAFLIFPDLAVAWDGYDYDSQSYIDIEKGNLVREGEEIEFYDYESGEYRTAEVEDVQGSGDGAEVEVYDYESGEYRSFEME